MTATAQTLEAEIAGDEKAIRHLIGERAALTSKIKRRQALEKLHQAQLKHVRTTGHPAVRKAGPAFPHGSRFPDVSSFQPHVDLAAVHVAKSLRVGELCVVKISEGLTWTDAFGAGRWRAMAADHYAHRGGYHFLHPSESPDAQADHMLAVLHAAGVVVRASDILVADLEVSDGQSGATLRACAAEFAKRLRAHVPAKIWLYAGGPFAREYGLTLAGYDAHWLPAYVGDPKPFYVFGTPIAWQYSDGRFGPSPHVCPGVGACDMSIIL